MLIFYIFSNLNRSFAFKIITQQDRQLSYPKGIQRRWRTRCFWMITSKWWYLRSRVRSIGQRWSPSYVTKEMYLESNPWTLFRLSCRGGLWSVRAHRVWVCKASVAVANKSAEMLFHWHCFPQLPCSQPAETCSCRAGGRQHPHGDYAHSCPPSPAGWPRASQRAEM